MDLDWLKMASSVRRFVIASTAMLIAIGGPSAQGRSSRTVAVAAASDLQAVLPALLGGFEKATGIKATVSFGSSGNFFAQIHNGAPFDVFFSADVDYPRRLVAAGEADADTLYEYATGRLVLWTRTDSGLDVKKGLALLREARVRRIAIANPAFAPYGRAAIAALKSQNVYEAVKDKLVFGENIAQAAQLAHSGNADVGLISHSLAVGAALKTSGTFIDVPPDTYPAVVQAAVLVSAAKNKDAGRALLQYIRGAEARTTFDAFGFGAPPRR
jgi:molybdate transport system substrate-binding protein